MQIITLNEYIHIFMTIAIIIIIIFTAGLERGPTLCVVESEGIFSNCL